MGELGALGRRTWGWATRRLRWGRPVQGSRQARRSLGPALLAAVVALGPVLLLVGAAPVHGASVADPGEAPARNGVSFQPEQNDTTNDSGETRRIPGAIELASVGNVTTVGADGTVYVWSDAVQTVETHIEPPAGFGFDSHSVCLEVAVPDADRSERTCRRVVPGEGARSLALNWTGEEPGVRNLVVTLVDYGTDDHRVLDRENATVHVMAPDGDVDTDKLTNRKELAIGTNLTDTDTDDDGLMDGAEVTEYGTDPLTADSDGDGLRDALEIQQGTDPLVEDTDGDGATDPVEVEGATDPTLRDTDWDGVVDGVELERDTDPLTADTDDDGLSDGLELKAGTDPTNADTDGDLLADGFERRLGTDPTSAALPAVGVVLLAGLVVGVVWTVHRRRSPAVVPRLAERRDTGAAPGTVDVASTAEDDGPLTDRDRIRQLLREADGRLKQARIVEQTSWSKAKVSRVLSGMEDDGEISKIRIGRENLICLKGQEPDLARPSV